jgi:Domain of unknown function (DUF4145)
MSKYYPPKYGEGQYHCVHCGVYAAQYWKVLTYDNGRGLIRDDQMNYCVCSHCKEWSYWYNERMIVPSEAPVPPAHADMPEKCKADYDEARDIVARSPKAASALLRLALQKLMPELGEKGKNINEDIGSLVSKGLPDEIQQALDYCRVVGNNAVHPGELKLDDTPEIAHSLFEMMNFIIDDRISRPKKVATMYDKLPEGAKKAIVKRDGK